MSQFSLDKSTSGRASAGTVSGLTATAIVIADMVGVGVFTSLGFQVKDIPSGFAILLLWSVGGIVALCGVFSYSELGAMFPRSSGDRRISARWRLGHVKLPENSPSGTPTTTRNRVLIVGRPASFCIAVGASGIVYGI